MNYTDFLEIEELKAQINSMNNRARTLNAFGTVTISILRDRIYESAGKCEWCAESLVGKAFEVDHIVPLNRAGKNTPENLAIACPACNRRKSSMHPPRFAQEVYARTGILTPLLERIFSDYDIEARTQKSLFDLLDGDSAPLIANEDTADEQPPYIWGNKS